MCVCAGVEKLYIAVRYAGTDSMEPLGQGNENTKHVMDTGTVQSINHSWMKLGFLL